jgi:hypothetical protein
MRETKCYRCGRRADTKEHIPPRPFFPKGGNLQLKTVPSCKQHNNDKSGDDQYLLAHICMNAAGGENLPKPIFLRSISPFLHRNEAFRKTLAEGSINLPDGTRKYKVNTIRFDNFFDHLSCALYFDRYGEPLDDRKHKIHHCYLSLTTENSEEVRARGDLTSMLGHFYRNYQEVISKYEADKINESVYQNKIIDPVGKEASITIAHTFYGIFNVVSLLTRQR